MSSEDASCRTLGKLRDPIYDGDYTFNMGKVKQLSALDYLFFTITLLASLAIGLYNAWGSRRLGIEEFLVAGRAMGALPVGMSLLASFQSAVTILGVPQEIYMYDTMFFWMGICYFFVVAAAAHLYHPVFYRLRITTAHEYVQMRFSSSLRSAVSCIFVIQMIIYMSMVLYAPAVAISAVTDFSLWGCVLSVGIVCTLYTAVGGLKAVLWTDTFQIALMVFGLITVLIFAALEVGGGSWTNVWRAGERTGRIKFLDFRVDPSARHTVWSVVIGGYFTWTSIFGVNQAQIQRVVACKTFADAKLAIWSVLPGLCLIHFVGCLIGFYLSDFYENCDPLEAKLITGPDQLLPLFVMDIAGDVKGLPGVFMAALFSGALSTISSGLNSVSAAVLEDFVRAHGLYELTTDQAKLFTQVLSLVVGCIVLGSTYIATLSDSILFAALAMFSLLATPILGVYSLGMFFPWTNATGAFCGLFTSIGVTAIIIIVFPPGKHLSSTALTCISNCHPDLFNINNVTLASLNVTTKTDIHPQNPHFHLSYMWNAPIAFITCVLVGLAVSGITGPSDPKDINPQLMVTLCDIVFPFYLLPESIKGPLRLGIPKSLDTTGRKRSTKRRLSVPNLGSVIALPASELSNVMT